MDVQEHGVGGASKAKVLRGHKPRERGDCERTETVELPDFTVTTLASSDAPTKTWLFTNIQPLKLKVTWTEEASLYVDQWLRLNDPQNPDYRYRQIPR